MTDEQKTALLIRDAVIEMVRQEQEDGSRHRTHQMPNTIMELFEFTNLIEDMFKLDPVDWDECKVADSRYW